MRAPLVLVSLFILASACSSAGIFTVDGADARVDDTRPPALDEAGAPADGSAADDVGAPSEGGAEAAADAHDAAPDAPSCAKHVTALFTVGTGAGSLASHATSGCWDVVDADGAANNAWRKCSTNKYTVVNAGAVNWAFDDSAPTHDLTQDKDFISKCSAGATGIGFEYLAYRGGWRLLFPYPGLKAFVAELHSSDFDVDDYWPSAYVNNQELASHTVYPMFNIGPRNDPSPQQTLSKIEKHGESICKTIRDKGYFGIYVGTWDQPMPSNDPRIVALAKALDACTKK
jgi:hypothetical protein